MVDVIGALEGREYHCAPGKFIFLAVDDDPNMCPWNTGLWQLVVGEDGLATVTNASCVGRDVEADSANLVALGVRALASLWAGQSSALQLGLWGLAIGEEVALQTATEIFATRKPPQCFTGF